MSTNFLNHCGRFWLRLGVTSCFLFAMFLPLAFVAKGKAAPNAIVVGLNGPSFGDVYAPTASEMQSKLWFNDGIWWGSLYNATSEQFEIFRYDSPARNWITTETVIDTRKVSRADCLWDGNYLYVASAVRPDSVISNIGIQILRFRYDPGAKLYTLDDGFPILLTNQKTYGIVLDQDTTGTLWVTYTAPNGSGGSSVYVSHSNIDGIQWVTPYILPVNGASDLLLEDISSLAAFSGQIGLMWSNQNEHAMYFAVHKDGDPDYQWQSYPTLQGTLLSDNHINLKSFNGRLYSAIKTSLNDQDNADPNAPLMMLLEINPDGSWTQHIFGTVAERHTRPLLMIDADQQTLYFFATSFCCGNGKVYYKQISLENENAQFPPGLGLPFLELGDLSNINNITSTKQPVSTKEGFFVLAEDSLTGNYVYNSIGFHNGTTPVLNPPIEGVVTRVMIPIIIK